MKTIITLFCTASIAWAAEMASGTVFNDANGNGQRDPDEKGLAGVGVSNGEAIVETDADGRWQLPVTNDTILFVLKLLMIGVDDINQQVHLLRAHWGI